MIGGWVGPRRSREAAFLFGLLTLATAPCGAASVSYTDLYTLTPPAGMFNTYVGESDFGHPATGGKIAGGSINSGTSDENAVVWSPAGPVPLHPASGYSTTVAAATDGGSQVGFGNVPGHLHAALWTGSAASFVDLDPGGFYDTQAWGVGGGQQVGFGRTNPAPVTNYQYTRALLWSGTPGSVVNLHPAAYENSELRGTDGIRQVGEAEVFAATHNNGVLHAMVWSGSADSYVDLHPASGFSYSYALNVSGSQEVGYGLFGATASAPPHALLWSSTADSVVDLQPPGGSGFSNSRAYGTDGFHQVGYGANTVYGQTHALFWSGTPESYIDLGAVLPSSTFGSSFAYAVSGNTVYGSAVDKSFRNHAIVWTVPEPGSLSLLGITGAALLLRRSRK